MAKVGRWVAGGWVLAAWLGACGSGDGGGTNGAVLGLSGASQDEIAEAYCERFASEFCEARRKCCANLAPEEGPFRCEDSIGIDCALVTGRLSREGRTFSSERTEAVFRRLREAADSCGPYRLPAEDDPYEVRLLPLGAECFPFATGEACESGLNCVAGECSELGNEGDPCGDSNLPTCGAGLYCTAGACAPQHALGETCAGFTSCEPGLSCVSVDGSFDSEDRCFEPRPAGETCLRNEDCLGGSCGGNRTCTGCVSDADCSEGRRCTAGECTAVFNVCGEPTYFR